MEHNLEYDFSAGVNTAIDLDSLQSPVDPNYRLRAAAVSIYGEDYRMLCDDRLNGKAVARIYRSRVSISTTATRSKLEHLFEVLGGVIQRPLKLENFTGTLHLMSGFKLKRTEDLGWLKEAFPAAVVFWSRFHEDAIKIHFKDKWAQIDRKVYIDHTRAQLTDWLPEEAALREQVKAAAEKHGVLD